MEHIFPRTFPSHRLQQPFQSLENLFLFPSPKDSSALGCSVRGEIPRTASLLCVPILYFHKVQLKGEGYQAQLMAGKVNLDQSQYASLNK